MDALGSAILSLSEDDLARGVGLTKRRPDAGISIKI